MHFRQVHLDFHTSPAITGVGDEFCAETFADQMAEAHVQSVTLFAKCHHGLLYYDTQHPARHPHLTRNLLAEQIEALHAREIRTPIYLSVQVDELATAEHPEWIAVDESGKPFGPPPFERPFFTWHTLDMASPYQDYLIEQLREVLRLFKPLDGLFFDMCWDQESFSKWAFDVMRRNGLKPQDSADRARHANQVSHGYMERIVNLVTQEQGEMSIAFNSRPLQGLAEEKKFLRHVEIEALATGAWGYQYFPRMVRFVRPFGLPMIGMTGRFHKSWGDFGSLKPRAALLYECAASLAHGAGCSIGDQMHPRGTLEPAAYDAIGEVFSHVKACEPFCEGAGAVSEIAVLHRSEGYLPQKGDAMEGALRIFRELGSQFDFLPPTADFSKYRLVVVPEGIEKTEALEKALSKYLSNGGGVIREDLDAPPMAFAEVYFRLHGVCAKDFPLGDHVFYESGPGLEPVEEDEILATVIAPYFDRSWEHYCSHCQTPPDQSSGRAAAIRQGNLVRFGFPIFRAYATHGNLVCRQLVRGALELLLPDPVLRTNGPSFAEFTVTRQPGRMLLHGLLFSPRNRGIGFETIEEEACALDLHIDLKTLTQPCEVTLEPSGEKVPFAFRAGRTSVELPTAQGHLLLAFHFSA